MMIVYVVMRNDYPDSVWSTLGDAQRYIRGKNAVNKVSVDGGGPVIYWRSYEFIVDTSTRFGE